MATELAISRHIAAQRPRATIAAHPAAGGFRIFDKIEIGHGIAPVLRDGNALLRPGDVVVYDETWLSAYDIVEGPYVVEYQRPTSTRFGRRSQVERAVVRVDRCRRLDGHWYIHPLSSVISHGMTSVYQLSDGPISANCLAEKLLGPVIGVYRGERRASVTGGVQ